MCSTLGGIINQQKMHSAKSHSVNLTSSFSSTGINGDDDMNDWCAAIDLLGRLFAYITLLAVIMLIVYLIIKFFAKFSDGRTVEEIVRVTSASPLCVEKTASLTYGTCDNDLESGNCSTANADSSCNSSSSIGLSEDLYDGKLCITCYDEERNCFFVPCGHCATCYVCAQRIFNGENKVCPVCRRFIGKVRKLFAS